MLADATSTAFHDDDVSYQSGARTTTKPSPYGSTATEVHEPDVYTLWAPEGSEEVASPETAFTEEMEEGVDAKIEDRLGTLVQLPDVFVEVPTEHEETEKLNALFRKLIAFDGYATT